MEFHGNLHQFNRKNPQKMSDRKAVIKNADMSEEMQQDAVDCATQALEKYNIEKVSSYLERKCVVWLKWRKSLLNNRISLLTLRRNSTRSTTRPGIALSAATLDPTWLTRLATSSTSIWARLRSCCSRADELIYLLFLLFTYFKYHYFLNKTRKLKLTIIIFCSKEF